MSHNLRWSLSSSWSDHGGRLPQPDCVLCDMFVAAYLKLWSVSQMILIVGFFFFFHLDEICQACIVLSPIKMVPETQLW